MKPTKLTAADALVDAFMQYWERRIERNEVTPIAGDHRKTLEAYTDWLVKCHEVKRKRVII